ncbi:hypothetical protein KKG45_12065 [bacterium]|nr:hypothetical protein [bacterium]MBU1073973.1 hypothetical protein [bacterium]MBU1675738.1 hypothetical protein [bacterium]
MTRHDMMSLQMMLTAALVLVAAPARAGDPEINLGTTRASIDRLDMLVQPLEVVSGGTEAQEAAWLVESVIRIDLDYSGFFRALSVEDMSDTTQVQYAVEGLLEGRLPGTGVTAQERAPLLTLKLVAYPGRQLLLSKRYRPTWDRLRATAHHFVNELHLFLNMEAGISLTKVVFARGTGERRDIYCVDYDGENLLRLTANRTLNLFPAWAPDNDRVAFMSYRDGQQGIYLLDTGTGKVRLVNETIGSNLAPAWHPEGEEVLVSLSKVGQHEIYRMDLAGKIIRRLTVSPAIEISPSWSPTGRDVVFTSDRTGSPQLYIMDADGSGRRRLTFEGRYNDAADWSPSGEQIIYACRDDDITQIVLIEAHGENRRVLTDTSWRNCEDPSWAPDGRHIVFASDRTGVFKLYVMDVRDGASRQLTFGAESDKTPDWSP